MSYDNLSSASQNVLKFYQLLTGEERRIPFIFDGFHFCYSRVITLDMTESRVFYPYTRVSYCKIGITQLFNGTKLSAASQASSE
jgi:hypothetical protein